MRGSILRRVILDLCWRILRPRVTLSSGLIAHIPDTATWRAFGEIFAQGAYDRAIDAVVTEHSGPEPPVVLDLGANVGLFALRFADRWLVAHGRRAPFLLVGVEGVPETFRTLTRTLEQPPFAGLYDYRHGLVGGHRQGVARITTSADHLQNTILPAREHADGRQVAEVPYLDLDWLLHDALGDTRRIALTKIDIEGAERDVLANYPRLLARTDRLVIELHGDRLDPAECVGMIEASGLRHQARLAMPSPEQRNTVEFFAR